MARQAADETLLRSRGASPLQASLRNGGEKGLSDALLSPTTNVFGQDQNVLVIIDSQRASLSSYRS